MRASSPRDQITKTIRLIGQAIKDGSKHLPIRNHAAALATQAGPRDYLGQLSKIYDQFVRRDWRYVRDPLGSEMVVTSPDALYNLVIGGGAGAPGIGLGKGAGDCDDAAAALGALLRSIGFPVRLGVTAPPGALAGNTFTHVFTQASVPGVGWLTVDPVPWPKRNLGYMPDHSRIAFYDLDGRLLGFEGNVNGLLGELSPQSNEVIDMYSNNGYGVPDLLGWADYGLAGLDYPGGGGGAPADWRKHVLKDFGIYSERLGIMSGEGLGLSAEVETWIDPRGFEISRTPMIELAPDDYGYVNRYRRAYHGMLGLGDDGQAYEYDGFSGFFKRLFKKAKSFVKKIGAGIKKVIRKIPGGKYLIKLGEKVHKIAMKFVKPLVKFVGKYAAKLAPIAALIPGYGTAIAAGLYTAGKIANLMQKYGVEVIGKKGEPRNLKFKSGKGAKEFQKALKKEAEKHEKELKQEKREKKERKAERRQVVKARRSPRPAAVPVAAMVRADRRPMVARSAAAAAPHFRRRSLPFFAQTAMQAR